MMDLGEGRMPIVASVNGFLRRRVILPLMAQLKQGSSPDELATSLAAGGAIALFPIIGTTTALCALVGHFRKLNHVAMQMMNYLMFPLHIGLIVPFLKMGDWLFGARVAGYSISTMMGQFGESPLGFAHQYGGAALRASVAWAVVVPLPALLFRASVRPWLRRLAAKIQSKKDAY
jgi:uncharacterized protein (DUF2062 family)